MFNIIKAPNTRWVEEAGTHMPVAGVAYPAESREKNVHTAAVTSQWETQRVLAEEIIKRAKKQADDLVREGEKQAAALLADTKKQADSLLEQAEKEVESLRGQARTEGFSQGRDQGYKEGSQAARDEVFGLLQKGQEEIDGLLQAARAEREKILKDAEPQLLKLSVSIAGKILGYEIEHNDSAFLSMVREALSSVKAESAATLRVNPSEYVRFFKSREVNIHTPNGTIAASVINDPTVGYGGCLIETESGVVDAGVSAQIDQVARHFGLGSEENTNDKQ